MEQTSERRYAVFMPAFPLDGDRYFLDDHCANCLDALQHNLPRLFCGDWCRTFAADVRYARATTRDGRFEDDPTVRESIAITFAHQLIGGYDSKGRAISPNTRSVVLEAAEGRCRACGAPANQIDHISGGSNTLDNLQLLCDACHRLKTNESMEPAPAEEKALLALVWKRRICRPAPALLADDETRWSSEFRGLERARDRRLDARVSSLGIPGVTKMNQRERAELLAEVSRYN